MKICMHTWMRPEPLATTIERLGRHGYDGIEIAAEPAVTDVAEVRDLLERHNLTCAGCLAMLMGGRDLFHEDSYVRQGTVRYVQDTIRLTNALGGRYLTIPPTVGKVTPMGSARDEWQWYVESLRECLPVAAESDVRLVIEPLNRFESYLINRADQALALAEAVGAQCAVCLDIFHMNIEEADWAAAIRETAPRLGHFHVADNNRLPPGQGHVDWMRLLRELQTAGYDGWLAVEFMPALDLTPVSQRADIGDASEADVSQAMAQWLRDHGSGVLPERLYDEWVKQSIDFLRERIAELEAQPVGAANGS
jgi:D-psicose/D-tagatose/L-ribulose 3-epimerase